VKETGNFVSGFADMLGLRADDTTPFGQLRSGFDSVKDGFEREVLGGDNAAAADMGELADEIVAWMMPGRGLHSSTFQLNLSRI